MNFARNLVCILVIAAAASSASSLIGGCRSNRKNAPSPPAPQAADAQQIRNIRDKYFRAYVESRVGVVSAARPQDRLVAVGDLDNSGIRENEVVTFLDGNEKILTTGTVVRVLGDSVHVRFDDPPRGGRAPMVGDLMVRVPPGGRTL